MKMNSKNFLSVWVGLMFLTLGCQNTAGDDQARQSAETTREEQAQNIAETIQEVAYTGKLPCPDCDYRQVTLQLKTQKPVYKMETIYVGQSDSVYTKNGRFTIQKGYDTDREAKIFILNPNDPGKREVYLQTSQRPDTLIQLSDDLSRLTENLPNELIRQTR